MRKFGFNSLIAGLFFSLFTHFAAAQPGPGPGYQCPNCGVEYPDAQILVEIISDYLEIAPGLVTVEQGEDPNVYTVTLPDNVILSLSPVGPTFRYQNEVQRRLQQTEEGWLRIRSQTRVELQVRAAIHREAEMIGELLRLGWTNMYWFRHGLEVESPAGKRYCFAPDVFLSNVSAPGNIQVALDAGGYLIVTHADGIRQQLHACAHDFLQLRDQIRATVQQQLMINADGTFQLNVEGEMLRFRLNAELAWTDELDNPGFYSEGERILLRYRDGWAQEVIRLD